MQKPLPTPEQQKLFVVRFEELLQNEPIESQKLYERMGGIIFNPVTGMPIIQSNIQLRFNRENKSKYVDLLNALRDNRIK